MNQNKVIEKSQSELSKITCVIAIPSYNENQALPILVSQLSKALNSSDALFIIDDSDTCMFDEIKDLCTDAMKESKGFLIFNNHKGKSGRGAAIRRGMQISVQQFPNLRYFIECDADGSHRIEDILFLKDSSDSSDLYIGSRYLKGSQIKGWPMSRRAFSRILNIVIPRMLNIDVHDITNGLRRYSNHAICEILKKNALTNGFIHLSEQALIIDRASKSIKEFPITFVNREIGTSTVRFSEVLNSLRGLYIIYRYRKQFIK